MDLILTFENVATHETLLTFTRFPGVPLLPLEHLCGYDFDAVLGDVGGADGADVGEFDGDAVVLVEADVFAYDALKWTGDDAHLLTGEEFAELLLVVVDELDEVAIYGGDLHELLHIVQGQGGDDVAAVWVLARVIVIIM